MVRHINTRLLNRPLLALLAAMLCHSATAQTSTNLPGVRILQGTLVSPSAAATYYTTATTHSISVTGYTRAAEVVALANGLGANLIPTGALTNAAYAQRVNEYVYNNITTEFMFGLQKGALGALINQSGTPFDQAHLLGELLKVANISVTYDIGTITLTSSQFYNWTGITNAVAACRLLADGGIPALVNGSSTATCDPVALGSTVSTVQMMHVWVSALGNLYDPSFKTNAFSSGIDLAAAMACGTQASPTCGSTATSKVLTGANQSNLVGTVPALSVANQSLLESQLTTWAMSLNSKLASTYPNASLADIIGGQSILQSGMQNPSSSLPYGTPSASWAAPEIPDQFRTSLTVQIDGINQKLFTDEIAGQQLHLVGTTAGGTTTTTTRTMYLYLEFRLLASSVNSAGTVANSMLTLIANHPYAASSGAYMDDTVVSTAPLQVSYDVAQNCTGTCGVTVNGSSFLIYRTTVIDSWGYTGKGAVSRASDIAKRSRFAVDLEGTTDLTTLTCQNTTGNYQYLMQGIQYGSAAGSASYVGTPGCLQFQQPTLIAQWLAEVSRATDLISSVNSSITLQHHILGTLQSSEWDTLGRNLFDVSSNISGISKANVAGDRRATVYSYSILSSRMEGGAFEHLVGTPEGSSTVSLYAKGNAQGERYALLTTPSDWTNYSGSFANYGTSGSIASTMVTTYLAAGDSIIAPQNWITPAQTFCYETGGCSSGSLTINWPEASMSTHPSSADATIPDRITLLVGGIYKGSAAFSVTDPYSTSLASVTAPQNTSVKSRKTFGVDQNSGALLLTPPPDLVTGTGAAPYSLSLQRIYSSKYDGQAFGVGFTPDVGYGSYPFEVDQSPSGGAGANVGYGWQTNWAISAKWASDAFQGLGEDSPVDAVASETAIYVLRNLYSGAATLNSNAVSLLVANWMVKQFFNNELMVSRPPQTDAFIRLPDGSFNAPPHSGEHLVTAGASTGPWVGAGSPTLFLDYAGVTASLTAKDGSTLAFAPYSAETGSMLTLIPSTWTYPSGVVISFSYVSNGGALSSVSNNLGRSLTFSSCTSTCSWFKQISDDTGRVATYSVSGFTNVGSAIGALSVVTPDGATTSYHYTSNSSQYNATRINNVLTSVYSPTNQSSPFLSISYDSLLRVSSTQDALGYNTNYLLGAIGEEVLRRSDLRDPLSVDTTSYFDKWGDKLELIDGLDRVTSYQYDNRMRLVKTTYPELNSDSYTYDARSNKLSTTHGVVPGSTVMPTMESTTYYEGPTVAVCANSAACNEPVTTTDANGNVTTYSYISSTGQLQRVVGAAVSATTAGTNGIVGSVQTDYCYGSYTNSGSTGTVSLLAAEIDKEDLSKNRVTFYTYSTANHLTLASAIKDPATTYVPPTAAGGACTTATKSSPTPLALTTAFTFDSIGNVASIDGPISGTTDTTNYSFDSMRRLTTVTGPSSIGSKTRYCYDADGELVGTYKARTSPPTDPYASTATTTGQCGSSGSNFLPGAWQWEIRAYYPTGDLLSVTDAEANTTTYAYDPVGRQRVVQDPDGRQTATVYDAVGQTLAVWKGGTTWLSGSGTATAPAAAAPNASTAWTPSSYTGSGPFRYSSTPVYTLNGKPSYVLDAKNNQTDYDYDGLDRLKFTRFPNPATGALCSAPGSDADTTTLTCTTSGGGTPTYERYVYDPNGNRTALLTRKGDTIVTAYNQANRLYNKAPAGQGAVSTGYNLLGEALQVTKAAYGSNAAHTTAYAYDAAGRETSETNDTRAVSYLYDTAGNRTRTTWPDGYYVTYGYDDLYRMASATENGSVALASYTLDPLSRRTTLQFGGAATNKTGYTYEPDSDLDVLTQTLNGTTVTLDYGRNHSHQITSIAANDDFYLAKPATAVSTAYSPNALNAYSSVGGNASTYDLNGNMLTFTAPSPYGKETLTYDSENRLISIALNGSTTASIAYDYDGLGRRASKTVSGIATTYLSDGDEEIGEYSGSTLLRRYITGPTIDDRIAHVEGSSTAPTAAAHTYYHTDQQGSVIDTTDVNGTIIQQISYDEYGNSTAAVTGEQFRYTGRRFDSESGLYYYRARYYSPQLGRFLQKDPVGYKDDLNLYTYVGNDPADGTDPTGKWCIFGIGTSCAQSADKLPEIVITGTKDPAPAPATVIVFVLDAERAAPLINWAVVGAAAVDTLAAAGADAGLILFPTPTASADLDECGYEGCHEDQLAENDDNSTVAATEHESGQRESTREKHEKGQARKKRDRGGEKGDNNRRPPRKRPPGYNGPWPKQ